MRRRRVNIRSQIITRIWLVNSSQLCKICLKHNIEKLEQEYCFSITNHICYLLNFHGLIPNLTRNHSIFALTFSRKNMWIAPNIEEYLKIRMNFSICKFDK